MLNACQTVLAFCLLTLDEGMSPLSGGEIEQVIKRRRAQMAFIRKESASIGGVDACSDEDWTEANAWVAEHLPTGYHVSARAALEEALRPLSRAQVRRAMEVVAAVVYWDGAVTEGEESLFHDLARVAKLSDRATIDDLRARRHRPPAIRQCRINCFDGGRRFSTPGSRQPKTRSTTRRPTRRRPR